MKIATLALGALLLGTTAASAQSFSLRGVVEQLRMAGWTDIDVERDDGRIEIEAERGRYEREWVYNARTGKLVSVKTDRDDDDDRKDRKGKKDRDDDDDRKDRKDKKDRDDDDRKDRKDKKDRDDDDDRKDRKDKKDRDDDDRDDD